MLDDARALGFTAMEAGPPGFLPADSASAKEVLGSRGLRLVGGFVTSVLHVRARRAGALAELERQAKWLADGGAEILVIGAASQRDASQLHHVTVEGLAEWIAWWDAQEASA